MTGERRLEAAISAVRGLPADAADVPDSALMFRMRQLTLLKATVEAALAEQVAAFDERAGARYDGQTSTQAWLRARLRLGGQASQLVQVARQWGRLPQLTKAFAAGEITLEHAAAVAQLVNQVGAEAVADYESILLDLARQAPPGRLRNACAHLRQLLHAEAGNDGPRGSGVDAGHPWPSPRPDGIP
jgi:hypothetical protein